MIAVNIMKVIERTRICLKAAGHTDGQTVGQTMWNQYTCTPHPPTHPPNYVLREAIKTHDDVIKWKHFPRYWSCVRGIHWSPVNSPHKGQWRGALMFSLICVWINGWVNNRDAGDLRRYRGHYDVNVMSNQNIIILMRENVFENWKCRLQNVGYFV